MLAKVKSDTGKKWSSFPEGACKHHQRSSDAPLTMQDATWHWTSHEQASRVGFSRCTGTSPHLDIQVPSMASRLVSLLNEPEVKGDHSALRQRCPGQSHQ